MPGRTCSAIPKNLHFFQNTIALRQILLIKNFTKKMRFRVQIQKKLSFSRERSQHTPKKSPSELGPHRTGGTLRGRTEDITGVLSGPA